MNNIEQLSQQLGQALIGLGWTVTTAESCTGGGIANAITEVAGSSAYFNQAYVTYSNEAKTALVDVPKAVLENYGAVSQQTVEAMATGAAKNARAQLAMAVSGIAGPGGGSEDKPVGTVWIAMYCIRAEKTTVWSQCFRFLGDRKKVREKTVETALQKALELVGEFE